MPFLPFRKSSGGIASVHEEVYLSILFSPAYDFGTFEVAHFTGPRRAIYAKATPLQRWWTAACARDSRYPEMNPRW
jgi:hypothetical protein